MAENDTTTADTKKMSDSTGIENLKVLENIEVKNKDTINHPDTKKSIKIAEKLIKGQGRILVRKSGTESKIRVMGESENKELLKKCVDLISRKIK